MIDTLTLGSSIYFSSEIVISSVNSFSVFGQKAYDAIMSSGVSDYIKKELSAARVYAEGRGIRIPVPDQNSLEDIFLLLKIKLAN